MTPEREGKQVLRAIRNIPVDQVAPEIAAEEQAQNGMWCIVAGDLTFVPADGGQSITDWDDAVQYALFVRYVSAHPERVHPSHEGAVAFVRSRLGAQDGA